MAKLKCKKCEWYNYNIFEKKYDQNKSYCGLHGRTHIENPDGKQLNLNGKGSCWYHPKKIEKGIQLEIKFF